MLVRKISDKSSSPPSPHFQFATDTIDGNKIPCTAIVWKIKTLDFAC